MIFNVVLTLAALAGGAIASVAGFGIGSILTPALAARIGTKLAVAAVSIPHVCGTVLRLWVVRQRINRHVIVSFGLASAAGGLAGALLHTWVQSALLGYVLGALLIFAAAMELTGLSSRLRFEGWSAWAAGGLSGLFGGLVGNQGGIRSAALLGFDISKESFVATATAIALMVDAARVPVYAATQGAQVAALWRLMALMVAGVIAGTILGWRVLQRIPTPVFRRVVAIIILALGIAMFFISGK